MTEPPVRTRRPPPPFRRVHLRRRAPLSPHMVRITLAGDELAGFGIDQPASSVRLLIPEPGTALVIPEWAGNEFLYSDGARPVIRTFTPRRFDAASLELDLDVVLHEGGRVAAWTNEAEPGAPAAVSGPGRGYRIDPQAPAYLLAGDETAIPAIGQLLEAIPAAVPVRVIIEVAYDAARLSLTERSETEITWVLRTEADDPGSGLVPALREADIEDGAKVWAAGEAAAMFQVRTHLFDDRALLRSDATVRGYWKRR